MLRTCRFLPLNQQDRDAWNLGVRDPWAPGSLATEVQAVPPKWFQIFVITVICLFWICLLTAFTIGGWSIFR